MDPRNKKIIDAVGKYSEFVIMFTNFTKGRTTSDMSIWERIKLFYYIAFKYRRLSNRIQSCIKDDVNRIANKHQNFIEIIASYIYLIETAKEGYKDPDEFLPLLLKLSNEKAKLSINSITDQNNQLIKYKVIVFGISKINYFYKDKACKTILDIDVARGKYSLDVTVYDLDTIENMDSLIDSKVMYRKIFQIQPDGELYNPNFKFDLELEVQDTMEYIWSCLFTISPLLNIIVGLTALEFIGYKAND